MQWYNLFFNLNKFKNSAWPVGFYCVSSPFPWKLFYSSSGLHVGRSIYDFRSCLWYEQDGAVRYVLRFIYAL